MKRKVTHQKPPANVGSSARKVLMNLGKLVIVLGFGYGVYWFLGWETVEIQNIEVNGQTNISPDSISKTVRQEIIASKKPWYASANILLTPTNRIENALAEQFPRIKSVTVEKNLPDTLYVSIEEREPYWKVCYSGECRGVSSDGYVIDRVSTATTYPELDLGRNPTEGEQLVFPKEAEWFQAIQSQLEEYIQKTPIRIRAEVKVEEEIKILYVFLDEDTYIMLDDDTEIPYQIIAFSEVYNSLPEAERLTKQYYDIRVKKRLYYQ